MKFHENWQRAQNVCKGTPFFWRKRIGRARKRPHKLPSGNGGKDDGAPNIYHKEDSLTALAAPHLKSESFWSLIQYICNLQVNLFQKLSFFNQSTQNITRACSLISRKIQVYNMLCTNIALNVKTKTNNNFCTQHVVNLYFWGNSMNNLLSYCELTDTRMRASERDLSVTSHELRK